MAFLGTEGKMTRFGDAARVADWIVQQPKKSPAPVPTPTQMPIQDKGIATVGAVGGLATPAVAAETASQPAPLTPPPLTHGSPGRTVPEAAPPAGEKL
jgi:hypothetical protein